MTTLDFDTALAGITGFEASPVHGGHFEDVNDDGFTDYVFHFREFELGVDLETPALTVLPIFLTANVDGGIYYIGQDDVRTNPNNPKSKGKRVAGGKGGPK
mgnify:CR=1 FL=1